MNLKLTIAAAFLTIAIALIISSGTNIFPILNYFNERSVWAPQYLSAGTLILPKLSDSILDAISVLSYITNDNF